MAIDGTSNPGQFPDPSIHTAGTATLPLEEKKTGENIPPEELEGKLGLDRILFVLALVLGVLLACSPIRNSDLWLHLATGKLMAENGIWSAGGEAFNYTAGGSSGVHPGWLFDLIIYGLYGVFGEAGLGLLPAIKVLLALGLGVLWVRSASGIKGVFPGVLAFLVIGPWLALRPVCLSYFFLPLTLWFLEKGRKEWTLGGYWPLWVLFLFWVNLDSWFFLGPLTVAVYFLGGLIPRKQPTGQESPKVPSSRIRLGAVLAVGLGVCLLNPNFLGAFEWPVQLGWSGTARQLEQDPSFQPLFSPWKSVYHSWKFARTIPGLAYWAVAVLGLGLFWMQRRQTRWDRLLIWIGLLAGSWLWTPLIPFFAAGSGFLLGRTLEDLAMTRFGESLQGERGQRLRDAFGAAGFFALVSLVIAAYPGWLFPGPEQPREWSVEMDPSVAGAAAQINAWRKNQQISPTNNGYLFTLDGANALAWLSPEEKTFVNSHLDMRPETADDFLTARLGLQGIKYADWRKIFRKWHINHVVLFIGQDPPLSQRALDFFISLPKEWTLLYLKDGAAIFGWRDPQKPGDQFKNMELNLTREAFSPDCSPAPNSGPENVRPFLWFDGFARGKQPPSGQREEARLDFALFQAHSEKAKWIGANARAGILVGGEYGPLPAIEFPFHFLRRGLHNDLVRSLDEQTSAAIYLGIRACRRALREHPHDYWTHFSLGKAYFLLALTTREGNWGEDFPMLGKIRLVQALTSLNRAILLKPDLLEAHQGLAKIYQELDYRDLELEHRKKAWKIYQAAGPGRGESPEFFEHYQFMEEKIIRRLEKKVKDLEKDYDLHALQLKITDRAILAGNMGLAGRATRELLKHHIDIFGSKGLEVELNVLLNTGYADKVKDWLLPEHKEKLGMREFHWIRAQAEAGLGNYGEAQEELNKISGSIGKESLSIHLAIARIIAHTVGMESDGPGTLLRMGSSNPFFPGRLSYAARMKELAWMLRVEAQGLIVRGILALEAGNIPEALKHFEDSRMFWYSRAGKDYQDPQAVIPRRIADYWIGRIQRLNPK